MRSDPAAWLYEGRKRRPPTVTDFLVVIGLTVLGVMAVSGGTEAYVGGTILGLVGLWWGASAVQRSRERRSR
jgi:uncharacterized membrane protein (DUF4010 family)